MTDFRPFITTLRPKLVERRRDFHLHPELAFREIRTAGIVAQVLGDLGIEVQTGVGKTGVVGLLEGAHPGPTVLVRCDMDALPIEEENQVDYRSQTPQTMHACGHDGHTAIGLAVAETLAQYRDQLAGTVKFVFQPAEEIGKGALAMIDDGVLSTPSPQVSLGLHLWNELPVGEVAVTPGPLMAGADSFDIHLKGRGGHGGLPNSTIDPIITAAHILTMLQTIVSRNVPPLDTAVVSATLIHAGSAHNIIPEQLHAAGTIRTYKKEVRDLVVERFNTIVQGTARSMGCEAEVVIQHLSPPVINDAEAARRLKSRLAQTMPDLKYREDFVTPVAEDMAFFLDRVPGVFFMVGSANAARGLNYGHHHPRFDFDEEALVVGAAVLTAAVAEYVLPA